MRHLVGNYFFKYNKRQQDDEDYPGVKESDCFTFYQKQKQFPKEIFQGCNRYNVQGIIDWRLWPTVLQVNEIGVEVAEMTMLFFLWSPQKRVEIDNLKVHRVVRNGGWSATMGILFPQGSQWREKRCHWLNRIIFENKKKANKIVLLYICPSAAHSKESGKSGGRAE